MKSLPSAWSLLHQAISLFLKNLKYFLKFYLASFLVFVSFFIVFLIANFALMALTKTTSGPIVALSGTVTFVAFIIIFTWLISAGLVMTKSVINNQLLPIKDLFIQSKRLILPLIGTNLLTGLIVLVGFILFIIPGIILAVRYVFTQYIVIEENLSGLAALKRSQELVKGKFWKVLGYSIFPTVVIFLISFITSFVAQQLKTSAPLVYYTISFASSVLSWVFGAVILVYSFLVYKTIASVNK